MAYIGAGEGPFVRGAAQTGAVDTGGGGGVFSAGTMVTLGVNTVGASSGTLGEGAGQFCWKTTAGVGRGAMGAGSVGVLAVTLEKMREGVCMAEN